MPIRLVDHDGLLTWTGDARNLLQIVDEHFGDRKLKMRGVEIGVLIGTLSAHMLKGCPNLMLFMVDSWEQKNAPKGTSIMGRAAVANEVTEFAKKRRAIIKADSLHAAKFLKGPFDWVFIDGDHSYAAVTKDIETWWKLVKMGGFIAGHDYTETGEFGVKPAVDEFVGREKLKLNRSGNCWWVAKPHAVVVPAPEPAQL